MYITVNDITGEKRIDPDNPILVNMVAVVIMLSENVQHWLREPIRILLKTGKKIDMKK